MKARHLEHKEKQLITVEIAANALQKKNVSIVFASASEHSPLTIGT
jgi:hypothetical protein